jgi:hypothetical protein
VMQEIFVSGWRQMASHRSIQMPQCDVEIID